MYWKFVSAMLRLWMFAPICGDFNMFGGLYRGVELLVTEDVCIEPAYYASSGVFFTQSDVSEKKAHLKIEALLSARGNYCDRLRGGVSTI